MKLGRHEVESLLPSQQNKTENKNCQVCWSFEISSLPMMKQFMMIMFSASLVHLVLRHSTVFKLFLASQWKKD